MSDAPESSTDLSGVASTPPPLSPPPTLPLPALPPEPAPAAVGRFRIDGELGRGGMGVVYRGLDPDLNRAVAVKVLKKELSADAALGRRFLEEAQVCGQLQHPGVVPVHELGRTDDGRLFFAMKLVKGRTLAQLLKDRPDPSHDRPRFLLIFEQVCQAVAYAHSRGVIHRDLKPSNVMVGAFGEVQVMDWGLAKALTAGRPAETPPPAEAASAVRTARALAPAGWSEKGTIIGTPPYMPPEQALGQVDQLDARSDVFGLGAVLCEVLTGKPPYDGRSELEVYRQAALAELGGARERLGQCGADPELVRLALACLAPAPADRPADAGAAAAAVAAYRAGVEKRLREAELAKAAAQLKAAEERKRRRLTAALAALVLLVAAAGGALAWRLGAERVRSEREAEAAVREAVERRDRAREAPDDLTKWAEALAAAKRADALAGGAGEELRRRAAGLLAQLEEEAKDRRLLARLDEARSQWATLAVERKAGKKQATKVSFDRAGAATRYGKAFHDDMRLEELTPEEAAGRINRRAVRSELLAALANWAYLTPDKQVKERLLRIARLADPAPTAFRNRWAAAWEGRDREALVRLSQDPEARDLPPADACLLADRLGELGAEADAAALLREARKRHADDFWVNFDLANHLGKTRPVPAGEVVRFYTAALALRPRAAAAHNNLGNALDDLGRADEAVAECRAALELEPGYANAHNNLGVALYDLGRKDEAVAEYREALRLNPDDADFHINLGNALGDLGRKEEAVAEYREAIRLKPDDSDAHNNLGLALSDLGRKEEAVAEYREATRLNPGDSDAHFNLGSALDDLGRKDEAVAEYREAIRLNPGDPDAHYNLGVALSDLGRNEEAVEEYCKALRLNPADPDVHGNLGAALRSLGRTNEAVAEYREALRIKPDDAGTHYNLGVALSELGRKEEAAAEYREALRIKPDDADARTNLGLILLDLERPDEAAAEFRVAVKLNPDDAGAHVNLGAALQRGDHLEEAMTEYRSAIRLNPDYALAYCNLGLALQDAGELRDALASLRHGHALGARDPKWAYPSEAWVRNCERLVEIDGLLPAVLRAEAAPADAAGYCDFARLCKCKRRYVAAARLMAQAFAAEPGLQENLESAHRYNAACWAARAGCGRAADAHLLDDDQRSYWRKRSLDWLRADFVLREGQLNSGKPNESAVAKKKLRRWRSDPDLSGVRDADALDKLPEGERADWRQLWADVDALIQKASPEKK
jgi:serine/threonine-protein kinase